MEATAHPGVPASGAAARRPRRAGGDALTALAFLLPSLAVFGVFIFWPLTRTVYLSLHGNDIIGRPTRFVGLTQYQLMLSSPGLREQLLNTVEFTVLTAPTLVVSLLLALLLQQRIAAIGVFRTLLATPFAFSVATASVVFAIFFNPGVGVLNGFLQVLHLHPVGWLTDPRAALPSIALASVWLQLGYCVLVISAGLQAIPEELYEAARLDGAGGGRMAWSVTLPLLTPTLFFLLVVNTIQALQSFGQIHILTRGGPAGATTTIVYAIYYNAFAFGNSTFGLSSAMAMVLFAIVLAVTAVQFGVLERRVFYR